MQKTAITAFGVLGACALLASGLAVAALAGTNGSSGIQAATGEETSEQSTTEGAKTFKYKAALSAGAEVPKPAGVPAGANGAFTVTLTQKGSAYSVAWKLTYSKLSGKALAAHVHKGKPGKAGPVVVALCTRCKSGQAGKASVSKAVVDAMKSGSAYVNLHTAKNKAGEIRGQVKLA